MSPLARYRLDGLQHRLNTSRNLADLHTLIPDINQMLNHYRKGDAHNGLILLRESATAEIHRRLAECRKPAA